MRNITFNNLKYDLSLETASAYLIQQSTSVSGSIEIPGSVNYEKKNFSVNGIAEQAFLNCAKLSFVAISEGITSIGNSAFQGCTSLASVTIPKEVTSIGQNAFQDCSSIAYLAFPEGVTTIHSSLFQGCKGLISVSLPSTITSIEDCAFQGCVTLKEIYILNETPPDMGFEVFTDVVKSSCKIYVPKGSLCDYKEAELWKDFPSIIEESNEFYVDNLKYTKNSNITSVQLVRQNTSLQGVLVIPEKVTYQRKTYGVTSIAAQAFYDCSGITSVTIPSGVNEIGEYVFRDCGGLTSVSIPEGISSLGRYAFQDCTNLSSITIPEGVSSIGVYAFQRCKSLVSVTIPSSVSILETSAFQDCRNLKEIHLLCTTPPVTKLYVFSGVNTSICTLYVPAGSLSAYKEAKEWMEFAKIVEEAISFTYDGIKYTKNADAKTVMVALQSTTLSGDLVIPKIALHDGKEYAVTSISYQAFSGCSGLTSIVLPEGVICIGESAFSGCSELTTITIPSTVSSIGYSAFGGCSALTTLTIPVGVKEIGEQAFAGCERLNQIIVANGHTLFSAIDGVLFDIKQSTLIAYPIARKADIYVIPNTVTTIAASAFLGCTLLGSVKIPDGVTVIGNNAFSACCGLTSVKFPSSVISIGEAAFEGCCGLTEVIIPKGVTSIREASFSYCCGLTSVIISSGVTSIHERAFYHCSRLTSITIPKGVTSIRERAFYNCTRLKTFYSLSTTPPVVSSYVFAGVNRSSTLYVPGECRTAYEVAARWKDFPSILEYINEPDE